MYFATHVNRNKLEFIQMAQQQMKMIKRAD